MLAEVRRRADEFDVIHFHTDMIQFPMFEDMRGQDADHPARPAGPEGPAGGLPSAGRSSRWSRSRDDQRRPLPLGQLGGDGPPRHGRATSTGSARKASGYLAFLGRISPEKRPDRAIEIATRAGQAAEDRGQGRRRRPGLFRGRDRAAADGNPLVEFIGEIGDAAEVGLPRRRRRPAVPDRLARALRPGDDRGHGLRHAGDRLATAARCPR